MQTDICFDEWMFAWRDKRVMNETNGMINVCLRSQSPLQLMDCMDACKMLFAQKQSVCKTVNHWIIAVDEQYLMHHTVGWPDG